MKRRAPRQKNNGPSVHHARPSTQCRAIVRVDGTDIRKKIQKDYEKARRDLDNSRRVLDQFQQRDEPQFTRWLNSHFGALLTELRELSQKLATDEAIVFLVEDEVMFGGGSYARAYQRVMEPVETPPPQSSGEAQDAKRNPFGGRPASEYLDDDEVLMEEFLNALRGEFGPGAGSQGNGGPRAAQPPETAAPTNATKRIKELYRAVVWLLHPDSQRDMTKQKTEWWHQAQAAYEADDAEQLEVILTLCEIGESGTTAHTSASLLQRITAQLRSSLREIKRQIAQRRREPAWNFSNRTDHAVLAEQVRRELMGELRVIRRRWMHTQELIAEWKAAAAKLKSPRRRKAKPQNPEFPF